MAESGADRDEWMRRTGPFYLLVVAARLQTELPVAASLSPSDADRQSALPWIPLVGVALGLLLACVAALLLEIGMAPIAVAAVVAVLITVAGGLASERALASLSWLRWLDGDRGVAFAVSFGAALVLRVGLLAGVRPQSFVGAVIVAVLASRVVLAGALLLGRGDGANAGEGSAWIPAAVSGAVALAIVGLTCGLAGVAILAATAPLALAGAWWSGGAGDDGERARAAALVAELAAWLALAAALPA